MRFSLANLERAYGDDEPEYYQAKGFETMIQTIEADFDNETGNIDFRATFPNPDALLRHGETGNIEMDVPFKNATIFHFANAFEHYFIVSF